MVNPIKQLPRVIKTSRVEMRQLDVTRENAEMIFDAIKDENSSDFYFNPIGVDNIVPKSAEIERIAFEKLGANRITRQCSKDNVRSANSIKSSGFHLDGIARQGGVYSDGKLYDNMMWSKLRSEYVTK